MVSTLPRLLPLLSRLALLIGFLLATARLAQAQSTAEGMAPDSEPGPAKIIDMDSLEPHDFRAVAVRLPEGLAPSIDGQLNDDAWQLAPTFGSFVQREPEVGVPSTHRTEFRILYDDTRIYVAIWAFEPHDGGIVASELMRDAPLRKGDQIRVTFDTFHDHRNLFYFSTNPLGALKDAYATDNGTFNFEWNAVWDVKSSRDENGWYSEFEIPQSQLRFREQVGEQVWGINVVRIIAHNREESSFVPLPREWGNAAVARASGSGLLLGLKNLTPRRRLEFIPFLAPGIARNFDAGTPTDWRREFGADLRIGLTQTLNADLTYRTDFAQVEADQEVVNLSRFSLFFPEKRQFFTEGAGTFSYGSQRSGGGGGGRGGAGLLSLFYSRRIGLSSSGQAVPIIGGGRVTGNPGAYTVGLLNIETDAAISVAGDSVPRANYTVARIKRNVLSSSSIGVIALNRQGLVRENDYNRSLGVDGVFTLPNNVQVTSLLAKTFSPGTKSRDMAGVMSIDWTTDRFGVRGNYTDIQENFNAEMGFIPRVDIRSSNVGANWTPRPSWPGVRQLSVSGDIKYIENHQGTLQSRERDLSLSLMLNDGSNIRAGFSSEYDILDSPFEVGPSTVAPGGYSFNTFSTSFGTNDSRRVFGGGRAEIGQYYGGHRRTLSANLNFLAQETLLFENDYTRNRITLPNRPIYVTNTLNTRITYSVSPTLFLKAFVQYNDNRKLTNLNLLLWSVYRPGSDLYVVYNQGWETGLPDPDGPRVRGRSLAIKFTYWLSR